MNTHDKLVDSFKHKLKLDSWIANRLLGDFAAIVLFGKIHIKSGVKLTPRLVVHELVHVDQQQERGMILFTFIYLYEYIKNLFIFKDTHLAYLNISFEREAYQKEECPEYVSYKLEKERL